MNRFQRLFHVYAKFLLILHHDEKFKMAELVLVQLQKPMFQFSLGLYQFDDPSSFLNGHGELSRVSEFSANPS